MTAIRLFSGFTVAASSLAFIACGGSDTFDQPAVVQTEVALTAFDTCTQLENYLEDSALREVNVHLDNLKSFRNFYGWGAGPDVVLAENDAAPAAGAERNSAPTDYTETNVQVEGVDEADFVKTNGTHIFALSGQKLYMTKSWPANEMALLASTTIEGYPSEMFLDEDDNVVVFSHYYPGRNVDELYWCRWGCGRRSMTKVTVLSTMGDRLTPIHQVYLHGSYANARRIGSSVRIVLRDMLPLPEGVRWYPDNFRGDPRARRDAWAAAIDALRAPNEQLIRAQTLDDWLPESYYVDAAGNERLLARRCADFRRSNAPVRLGVASVATIRLRPTGISISRTSILGEVGEVYASHGALFIASPHWWWWPTLGQQNHTYFHKFDISNPSRADYTASGVVAGYPLNQFAMDEHNGFFRVATTIDRWTRQDPTDPWFFERETVNRVTVLSEQDGDLRVVGQTRDLAESERIQSARFMGDRGYLVTFEQIDPLFTLDLTSPRRPRVVGELKIPGFSSYLHPLDEDHLLAIGVDLPEPDENGRVDWSQRAMKLSIFDVSDFARPTEKFTRVVGTAYGWSEAAWEHKAFNYFDVRQTLAIPFSDYLPGTSGGSYWDHFVSDLRLFHIDVNHGITPRGSIDLSDIYRREGHDAWTWYWSPWVRRSVMADDFAYAISDAGIRVANMANPSATVNTVLFDGSVSRR